MVSKKVSSAAAAVQCRAGAPKSPASKKAISTASGDTEDDSSLAAWLDKGPDVNAKNADGYTLLHLAVVEGRTAEVTLLLNHGANADAKDKDGTRPLHWAAHRGRVVIAGMLLDKRADVNARDNGGNTPLHLAALRDHVAMASFLLDRGADANVKEKLDGGNTPLHRAATEGHAELVKLLLLRGARADSEDFDGLTPLDCAVEAGHHSLESLLKISPAPQKPVLKAIPAPKATKKTIAKSAPKIRTAPARKPSSRVADVAKAERPTRVAAKKRL